MEKLFFHSINDLYIFLFSTINTLLCFILYQRVFQNAIFSNEYNVCFAFFSKEYCMNVAIFSDEFLNIYTAFKYSIYILAQHSQSNSALWNPSSVMPICFAIVPSLWFGKPGYNFLPIGTVSITLFLEKLWFE